MPEGGWIRLQAARNGERIAGDGGEFVGSGGREFAEKWSGIEERTEAVGGAVRASEAQICEAERRRRIESDFGVNIRALSVEERRWPFGAQGESG